MGGHPNQRAPQLNYAHCGANVTALVGARHVVEASER
jgi:hypothetical protein